MLYNLSSGGKMNKPLVEIAWEGDSKDILSGFPAEVKSTFGFSLRRLQNGELPRCGVRPMASVGKGVWELKTDDDRTWYRVMYLSKIHGVIYVLHAFEKDSAKTDQRDIAIAKDRLKTVQQRLRDGGRIQ
jgi:phage-related protein